MNITEKSNEISRNDDIIDNNSVLDLTVDISVSKHDGNDESLNGTLNETNNQTINESSALSNTVSQIDNTINASSIIDPTQIQSVDANQIIESQLIPNDESKTDQILNEKLHEIGGQNSTDSKSKKGVKRSLNLKMKTSKNVKIDESTIKTTKIKSWSEKKSSIDYNDVTIDTPLDTFIKLKPPQPKSSILNSLQIDTDALFTIDYHSHICTKNVNGLMIGIVDKSNNTGRVTDIYPLFYDLNEDVEIDDQFIDVIKNRQKTVNYYIIGMYISHLDCQTDPTLADLKIVQKIFNRFSEVIISDIFFTLIASPYYDPKNQANIETSFSLFRINHNHVSTHEIPFPMKCEIKRNDVELSNNVLDLIKKIAYFSIQSDKMMSMGDTWWYLVTLRMKMIASCMQFVKCNNNNDEIIKVLQITTF